MPPPPSRARVKILESAQRRATKLVRGIKMLPYDKRLRKLKLMSIEDRLRRGDLIETYKSLINKAAVDSSQFFKLCEGNRTRGHGMKLEVRRSRLQLCNKFFANRVVAAICMEPTACRCCLRPYCQQLQKQTRPTLDRSVKAPI